jgi:hypothetical protein
MNRLQHFCEAKREAASDGGTGAKLLILNLEKQKTRSRFLGALWILEACYELTNLMSLQGHDVKIVQ